MTSQLNQNESSVLKELMHTLPTTFRKVEKSFILGLVGLVGSGKSTVAKRIAEETGAIVIEGDEVRVKLRERGERFDHVRDISRLLALHIIKQNGSVVFDSDHIDPKKRQDHADFFKEENMTLLYVRTFAEHDVMFNRLITQRYEPRPKGFFGGAAIAVREMWRRTPWHYVWSEEKGGLWTLKDLDFELLGTVDTTDSEAVQQQLAAIIAKLK